VGLVHEEDRQLISAQNFGPSSKLCHGNYASFWYRPVPVSPLQKDWLAYFALQKILIGHLSTKPASSLAVRVMRGKSIRANKGGGGNGSK
jgi:hypothetical protein